MQIARYRNYFYILRHGHLNTTLLLLVICHIVKQKRGNYRFLSDVESYHGLMLLTCMMPWMSAVFYFPFSLFGTKEEKEED